MAPGKWARRWADSGGGPLELVPLPVSGRAPAGLDIVLERVPPGERPTGTAGGAGDTSAATGLDPARLAVHLYEESLALVVAADHELAGEGAADRDALALVTLLAHPDHATAWPDPAAWEDPSWAPRDAAAALDLVATGLGAILLPCRWPATWGRSGRTRCCRSAWTPAARHDDLGELGRRARRRRCAAVHRHPARSHGAQRARRRGTFRARRAGRRLRTGPRPFRRCGWRRQRIVRARTAERPEAETAQELPWRAAGGGQGEAARQALSVRACSPRRRRCRS
ncbi:hypothetical protein [Leucobacter soli]|uniref:hypothetical protein n=1 Tax=Leucobacter soli TaxID=2812850 RepID=UPI00360C323C